MIDWLKLRLLINAQGKIPGGRILVLDPDGGIEWEKPKPLKMRGSHEASIHVSSCPYNGCLVIDGNPVKFFQGHNVFGTDDIHAVAHAICFHVLDALDLGETPEQREAIKQGIVEVYRVDINRSFAVGNLANARAAVRALAETATLKHRGRGTLDRDGTAYWGKHSRRSAVKAYPKGHELTAKDHKLPKDLSHRDLVFDFAQQLLRVELVLRGMELKQRGLNLLANWTHNTGTELFGEYLGKFNVATNIELPLDTLQDLPPRLRLAYDSWMRGTDLRATLPRMTFYRYRKQLLEHGVDILTVKPMDASNVVPIVRILEARPVDVPEWAIGTPLYFDPRRAA